jgi:sugar transferase (PEP-CTERM/EpsH1 system associated)
MAKILFLAHRAPFPPDKGDKIRAFHLLQHLAARHQVWLGAGADDLPDKGLPAVSKALCHEACIVPLGPVRRAYNMAWGALSGAPLSVARFRHPRLERWIAHVLRDVRPDLIFVYSSAQAQYVAGRKDVSARLVVDFVDADAQKWLAYAHSAPLPARWLYQAEARRLVRFERRALDAAAAGIMISETERRLQAELQPAGASKLFVIPNGVDTDFFRPTSAPARPRQNVVFCGRMDYAPNVDGAEWFVREILPRVRERCPEALFSIVGAAPTARVLALGAAPGVEVTGSVPDVRPYLAGAAVVVAPLRIARGIQNKVLEGLAAGRPVVATPDALDGIAAQPGRDLLVGADAESFAAAVADVLTGRAPGDIARNGRSFVVRQHRWDAQLEGLDRLIAALTAPASAEASAEEGRDAVRDTQGQAPPRSDEGRVLPVCGVQVREGL